jgi:hypothetical protein
MTIRPAQFTLRDLFVGTTLACCVLGCLFGLLRAVSESQKEAIRQSIRRGDSPPEIIDGVLIQPDKQQGPDR